MFFSEKTIILVGIYNQQFQGTIVLMVFDLQGLFWSIFIMDPYQFFCCENSKSPSASPKRRWIFCTHTGGH